MHLPQPTAAPQQTPPDPAAGSEPRWFVMRFLYNSQPAVRRQLEERGFETFCPMRTVIRTDRHGRKIRGQEPVIRDLYFVHCIKEHLDPYVEANPYFQYRFKTGGTYREPIVVPERQMELFIEAVSRSPKPLYFTPGELPLEKGARIRLLGGKFDGYECRLLKVKGARARRLIVEIPNTLIAAVEVSPDLIEILE